MKLNMKMLWYLIPAAVILGLVSGAGFFAITGDTALMVGTIFVVGGLLMGYFNIDKKEKTTALLIAILFATVGMTFAVMSFFEIVTGIIAGIMSYLAMVMVPAAVVVAIKESKRIAG